MVKLTMIARVTDGLPLAEGLDNGLEPQDGFYKQQAKSIFKHLSKFQNEPSRMSIETGPFLFHYIIEGRVCYLTMCDRSYPKKLAFQYLEDLKNEFERVSENQIETAARPFAFIKFDTFIQKTKKLYLDTRTQRNIAKLNDDLYEVQQIMTCNVQEVLGVGEKLDYRIFLLFVVILSVLLMLLPLFHQRLEAKSTLILAEEEEINHTKNIGQVSKMSSRLTSNSRIYADKASYLNRQALIRKWAPIAVVIGVVLLLFWVRKKIR